MKDGYAGKINNRIRVKEGWRGSYNCASDPKNCPYSGSITVSSDGLSNPVIVVKNQHNCSGNYAIVCTELINCKEDMSDMVKTMALDDHGRKAPEIAAHVMRHFENLHKGNAFSFHDRNYMENLVYRTRKAAYPDWITLIFSEPFRWTRTDPEELRDKRAFVRFCYMTIIDNQLEHFVGFAHPDILFEVGDTKLHAFFDCTFSIVPIFFSQMLVFMLYFSKYDLYVPFYCTLRCFPPD